MTMIARARLLLALAVICRSQASSVHGASADACPVEDYETSFLQVHKAVKFASDRSGEEVFAKEEFAKQVVEIVTNVHEEPMAGKAFIDPSTQSDEGGSIADEADEHMAGKAFIDPSTQSDEGWQIAKEAEERISADIEEALNKPLQIAKNPNSPLTRVKEKLARLKERMVGKGGQAVSTLGRVTTQAVQYMKSPDGQKVVLKTLKAAVGVTIFVVGLAFPPAAPALMPLLSVGSSVLFSALEAGHAKLHGKDVTRADVVKMFTVNVVKGGVMTTIGLGIDNPFDSVDPEMVEQATNFLIGLADGVCGMVNDYLGGGKADYQGTTVKEEIKGQVNCFRPSSYRKQGEEEQLTTLGQFLDEPNFGAEEVKDLHFQYLEDPPEHMAGQAFIVPSTQSGEGGSIANEPMAGKAFINPLTQSD